MSLQEEETNIEFKSTGQIYDKIFKRILTLSKKAVINFINASFDKRFPLDSDITYNWTENIKTNLEKTISDAIITINKIAKFHYEAQIGNDSIIVIRVFDYGYQDALKYKEIGIAKIKLTFPQPMIIFLEHNANTPDEVILELDFREQGSFSYTVPAMKFLNYTIEELNNKHMIILAPLYLLKLRREIEKSKKKGCAREKAAALKTLINDDIIKSIDDNEKAGNITHEDARVLMNLLNILYNHLYGDVKEFEEAEVPKMLAEKLIFDYEIERNRAETALKRIAEVEKKRAEDRKKSAEAEKKSAEAEKKSAEDKKKLENTIIKMLIRGMSITDIHELTEFPIEKIKQFQIQL